MFAIRLIFCHVHIYNKKQVCQSVKVYSQM